MDNKLILPGMILLASIIFILVVITALGPRPSTADPGRPLQGPTGSYLAVEQEGAVLRQDSVEDQIEIKNDDLVKCCSFKDQAGENQGCYALKNKGCNYCSSYCEMN
ncbi:MAG: hypothetical protein V1866_02175 [archaeon]